MDDPQRPKRHGTVIGDRNEDRKHVPAAPRGVGLTEPPATELAVPHEVEDRGTGVVEGPELEAIREDRPPLDRIRHLEKGLDAERREKAELRARLDVVEKSREELLAELIEMAKEGFTASLEVGRKKADENLASRRDWRGGIIKLILLIGGGLAAFFAGRKS